VRCRLHLRLRDREGKIVARNVQYLSFFPLSARRPKSFPHPLWVHDPHDIWDLEDRLAQAGYPLETQTPEDARGRYAVVSRLDGEVARFLEGGGTALFLPRSPADIDPRLSQRTGIRVRDRRARIDESKKEKNPWEGDWISNFTWIKHDGLFDRIPRSTESPLSGDLMDMQYYQVIPNQVLLGWSGEREFSDVHSGMVVGWVHAPVAVMAQCRWGTGRLLATTLKLESAFGDDPVATVLVHNLLGYLTSTRFRPQKDALAPRKGARSEPEPAAPEPRTQGEPSPAGQSVSG